MSSEHERIRTLSNLFSQASTDVRVGIGDDCAVLTHTRRDEVWTVDVAVEGTHFHREWMTLDSIGYRAFMAAASDVAAMGARARAALSALTLPAALTDRELFELARGIATASELCACPVVGGNLSRSTELTITTSVLGEAYGVPIRRNRAQPGDTLFVTGPLGASALGLRLLAARDTSREARPFIDAFLAPRARLDVAERLAHKATSAIDISDGLQQDAAHIAGASSVTLELSLAAIPTLRGFTELAARTGDDPHALILAGGEDYEVLFSAPDEAGVRPWATPIGRVLKGEARVIVRDESGTIVTPKALGFDHFR